MKVVALGCDKSGYHALLRWGEKESLPFEEVEVFSIPCLGLVTEEMMFQILENSDALLLAGCPLDSCHNQKGSRGAYLKTKRVNSLLQEADISKKVAIAFVTSGKVGEIEKVSEELIWREK